MKELEKKFVGKGQVKGFKFTQIKQNENGYIYEVESNGFIHYEVFKRKVNRLYNCISYPSNKSFGLWAKTYKKLDSAINYFKTL
jgi:hypothetical protein